MHRTKIEEALSQIDTLDRDLLGQIERRARLVAVLVEEARAGGSVPPGRDRHVRELEAMCRVVSPLSVRPIFAAIDAACRVSEISPRVACSGAAGGFSSEAAMGHFGPGALLSWAESPDKALESVLREQADAALVPLESVGEGLAFSTVRAISSLDLRLTAEHEMAHTLSVVAKSGDVSAVTRIYAYPQHHLLCEKSLSVTFPSAEVVSVKSPAIALQSAGESGAALVPSMTSSEWETLLGVANDAGPLRVRYGVVSRMPARRTGADATALLLSVHDRPGALYDLLQEFKEKNCNLRRIHSHAVASEGWEYLFYVEVFGHITDRPLVAALEGVKRRARTMTVIGSFPIAQGEPPASDPTGNREKR